MESNVLDYWKLSKGDYIVKLKKDDGLECDNNVKIILLSHLGAFILSISKRILNISIREFKEFYNINI